MNSDRRQVGVMLQHSEKQQYQHLSFGLSKGINPILMTPMYSCHVHGWFGTSQEFKVCCFIFSRILNMSEAKNKWVFLRQYKNYTFMFIDNKVGTFENVSDVLVVKKTFHKI